MTVKHFKQTKTGQARKEATRYNVRMPLELASAVDHEADRLLMDPHDLIRSILSVALTGRPIPGVKALRRVAPDLPADGAPYLPPLIKK